MSNTETTEIAIREEAPTPATDIDTAQRWGKMLSASAWVPDKYKGDVATCTLALSIAMKLQNTQSPSLELMTTCQTIIGNIHIIGGKPRYSGKLAISLLRSKASPFKDVEQEVVGKPTDNAYGVVTRGTNIKSGKIVESYVSLAMAKQAGWYDKNPLWRSITEQMLFYRSASFFLSRYAPELEFGMSSAEQAGDE